MSITSDICFNGFYDFTPKEIQIFNNFLKTHGEYRYTIGSQISYNSPKTKISALLSKITAKKITYGYLCCSVNKSGKSEKEVNLMPKYLREENVQKFPNGLVKESYNNKFMCCSYHLKVVYVENAEIGHEQKLVLDDILSSL